VAEPREEFALLMIELHQKKPSLLNIHRGRSYSYRTTVLQAYALFQKDVEYVVMDGAIKIVDEQTGRSP